LGRVKGELLFLFSIGEGRLYREGPLAQKVGGVGKERVSRGRRGWRGGVRMKTLIVFNSSGETINVRGVGGKFMAQGCPEGGKR